MNWMRSGGYIADSKLLEVARELVGARIERPVAQCDGLIDDGDSVGCLSRLGLEHMMNTLRRWESIIHDDSCQLMLCQK